MAGPDGMSGNILEGSVTGSTGSTSTQSSLSVTSEYKFWKTQPVPGFEEEAPDEDGPIKIIDPLTVDQNPPPMYPGFEWSDVDLTDKAQLNELQDLLSNHYVEDDDALFRLNYSASFLEWALKAPGWRPEWHVGVRASESRKLVAFISAIPVETRVRKSTLHCGEVNFICVHKKLRGKRLAPVLIKEITRRSYKESIFHGVYTSGTLLPTPISVCRYFHRSLNWQKLYDVGFSVLPIGSTVDSQVARYKLPSRTTTPGLRPMKIGDTQQVLDLLTRYLSLMEIATVFTLEELEHWLLREAKTEADRVIWAYVVEDKFGKITDFFSFFRLDTSVLRNVKHKKIHIAYLYYYASEAAWDIDKSRLKSRLNALMHDGLILARDVGCLLCSLHFALDILITDMKLQAKFDVFNALTLMHNPLFLEEQNFQPGDGQLHY